MGPPSPSASNKSMLGSGRKEKSALHFPTKPNLSVPTQAQTDRSKSPSHQAAELAAARSPDPSARGAAVRPRANTVQTPPFVPKPRRLSGHNSRIAKVEEPTDSSPIAPTTSLVDLFEQKSSMNATGKRPEPLVIRPGRDLALESPKPVRTSDGGITSMFQMELEQLNEVPGPSSSIAAMGPERAAQYADHSSSDDYVSASEDTAIASSPIIVQKHSSGSEDEDELHPYGKHKKKRLVRKHPNKHHEGDRKRWRDAVTERERKRYEGVWAANKGMHCSFTPEEQRSFKGELAAESTRVTEQVSNIVARDIWSRSRLPDDILEAVWDLVDSDCVGRLGKEEFVVALWLIDQRLKGRKLPVKVSESVWASVRSLQGIKIRKK
ncbi:hypothetical protein LTR08_000225 [Meristemomyces frigidus]|nr:hypothetical protein LTR08_000225 [Meristemomyces frigidus]